MDPTALRNGIQATLDANADVRRQAELDLKNAEENPGFSDALLNILETEQDAGVRLSSSVYLKNRVQKRWSPSEEDKGKILADSEKAAVRHRILPILRTATPQVRAQLVATLQKILHHDFPQNWPEFLQATTSLLNTQDVSSVFAGLQCLLAICRTYRFKVGDTRADFDQIVEQTFPHLLNIGNSLVNETSLEAGEMLRTVLKAYKHTIYFDLPKYLRGHEAMSGWCTLFLTVVGKTPPESSMMEDEDERETNHWWKCKKWSYVNLNRLFVRYGNPASLQKNNEEDYGEVAKSFIKDFAPVILRGYLEQIEKWVSKTTWLSKPCLSYTLAFMDECVKPKTMWDHLKPHMKILIEHLLFPVLCQSDDDIELFESDPQEYLHRKLNFYEEVSAPDVAATNFLVTLTKARRKQTFDVLQFVNDVVNRYEAAPDDQKDPREKEGALRMIGTLSGVILGKKSPIADQVEYFFVRHVFPEFRSKHGFLRARACDTLEKFEQLEFKDPNNLLIIYRNILESMADPELPVRVEAALALQPLIRHDIIRTSMQQNIPQIMQQLLKLANEVDVDALANVMEDFVEVFAAELAPFAVALSEQLRDTYLRIVREIIERSGGRDDENDYGDFLDDKSITALGVLQTIGTLILTLESTPDVLAHLETILMPVVTITLEHKLYDLYNEVFEIIDSCTYSAKTISPTMWGGFEMITKTFNSGGELYLEDMLPALENFVAYGSAQMVQHQPYLEAVVDMVRKIFKDDKVGGVDRICGCKLAEVMMLNLRGHIDQYLPEFVTLAMNVLTNDEAKVKSYKIHLMEMVINAIYCNPQLSLHVLEQNGWTNKFFSLWFSSIDMFTRVHDKKLSICAISALLTIPAEQIPRSVMPGWPRLLQGMVRLFQTLPAAEKNREEATKEDDIGLSGEYDDEDEDEWEAEVDWTNEEPEESKDVQDESATYLEFLSQQASKFSAVGGDDDDDDELEEESLLETPLDKVEPYGLLKASLMQCQQQYPEVYSDITKHLTPEEQQVIQAAVAQADQIAQQQQQALATGVSSPVDPSQVNGAR
ncbi:importin-beta N-terminal domain-containing protein 1 [Elsinoe australis]|uniref:Importin-beta N-terminal domain-containing protein 1 n=1 Tax=Elsinoe australis TaxID=40998 RepID=A0A4U7BE95_9PEZI|nr:importin-beta N-terminal domain-containing protein 1 [Elsinoe australis]